MQDVEPANRETEDPTSAQRRPWIEPTFVVVPVGETSNGGVIGINDGITAES